MLHNGLTWLESKTQWEDASLKYGLSYGLCLLILGTGQSTGYTVAIPKLDDM